MGGFTPHQLGVRNVVFVDDTFNVPSSGSRRSATEGSIETTVGAAELKEALAAAQKRFERLVAVLDVEPAKYRMDPAPVAAAG
jgi:hypothetical protein